MRAWTVLLPVWSPMCAFGWRVHKFDDPDGDGLEICFKQPRGEWNRERPFTEAGSRGRFAGPWDGTTRR
jgi:hypothetical protein